MSFVANLGESSVDLTARGWVATSEFWPTFFDLTRKSKTELEAAGFSIPFPQRDLHVIESAETASIAKPAAKTATKPAAKTAAKKPATRARSTAAKSTTAKKTPATKS